MNASGLWPGYLATPMWAASPTFHPTLAPPRPLWAARKPTFGRGPPSWFSPISLLYSLVSLVISVLVWRTLPANENTFTSICCETTQIKTKMDDRTMAMGAKQADGTTHIGGHGRVGRQRGARWRPRLPARHRRRQHRRLLLHATALPVKVCVYKFDQVPPKVGGAQSAGAEWVGQPT